MSERALIRRLVGLALLALALSCSGGKKTTAPPIPPDDPTPPVLAFEPQLFSSSQTILLLPPMEDLVVEVFTLDLQHAGAGGITAATDFTPGPVAHGDTLAIHVTSSWSWQDTDRFNLGVRVRRPGQHTTFPLCCLSCSHDGGFLQNGPCTR